MSDNFSRPQHTAPLTPILQLVNGSPIVLVAFFAVGLSWLFLLIGVIFLVVGGLGYWASWRKIFFWINEKGELEARSGIFFRRSRQLRISRLQSVDILRPPVARLLGYSSLKVEVAGSGHSRVILSYLSVGKAQELQSEILSVAKEERTFTQSAERGNYWQWRVPNGRLVASLVLTTSTCFLIITSAATAVIALVAGASPVALTLVVGGSVISLAGILSLFNFSVGRNERGIAISHGLFTTAHYTVSPIRIQAISLVQPIAWRPFGWYQIAINVAGTDQSGKKQGPRVLIPVVHEDALPELFRELLPSWNLEKEDEWLASATSSRWRFPWQAARLAVSVTPNLFMVRSGALTRRLSAAPHERIQSIRITQGPWERKLGISSLHADSVPGPVRLNGRGLGSSVAVHTALEELDRMFTARESQRSEQW
ncbi:MAG: PH domain-containing protein [Actinobacteria bacterium]|nr:PH domain-containing protein [Actinomycetota bacterium]